MKKTIALLLATLMLLTAAAIAETYTDRDNDLTFTYDPSAFEIAFEDETDDELTVVLGGTNADWGEYNVKFYLADLDDGEAFPTLEDFAEMQASLDMEIDQMEWNGFKDVILYTIHDVGSTEQVFLVPLYDDGRIDDQLTITITVQDLADEAAMARDDAISEVLDTMMIVDD